MGPNQDSVPQRGRGFPKAMVPQIKCRRGSLGRKGTNGASWGLRSRVKEPLEQMVAPDQRLMGPPEASGPQELIGLLETMWGPWSYVDWVPGQKPMVPLEQAGAQIKSQWGSFRGHGAL